MSPYLVLTKNIFSELPDIKTNEDSNPNNTTAKPRYKMDRFITTKLKRKITKK
jgi:hypothetical protein